MKKLKLVILLLYGIYLILLKVMIWPAKNVQKTYLIFALNAASEKTLKRDAVL